MGWRGEICCCLTDFKIAEGEKGSSMGSEDVSLSPRQSQHHMGTRHGERWAQSGAGEGARLQLVEEGCRLQWELWEVLSPTGSHKCAGTDKMNLLGFMADQNEEMSDTSESPESLSLPDASAEKATQGSDTDLEVKGDYFPSALTSSSPHSQCCTYQWVCIRSGEQTQTTVAEP